MTSRRRVVITGCGVESALGDTPEQLCTALLNGRSAVRDMPEWEEDFGGPVAAAPVVSDPERERAIPRRFRRSMGRAARFAALAAERAVAQAGLTPELLQSDRAGCVAGSTLGSSSALYDSMRLLVEKRRDELPAMQFFQCVSHSTAFNLTARFGLRGVTLAPCSACASALQAIGLARELIAGGTQDLLLAGGSDEATAQVALSFDQLFALAPRQPESDPAELSRPFDEARAGLVCGEGAGILVLEEYEHARRRGAPVLGEILGWSTNSGSAHVGQSDATSIIRNLELALTDANLAPEEIALVNAHATATPVGDRAEAEALAAVFRRPVPVNSLKGHLGHTLGASGAIELVATLEAAQRGVQLAIRNLMTPDPVAAGLDLIQTPRQCATPVFLKNSIAFGGINVTLICAAGPT